MRAYERLLKYVAVNTRSDDDSTAVPSTQEQFELAKKLVNELTLLGCKNVSCDDKCYIYAELDATEGCRDSVRLGFVAHMDTSPDFNGSGVAPQLIKDYDGGEVALGSSGRILSPKTFPHLEGLKGRTLITTDGMSLLGADDKAGIAEIMTLVERLVKENIPHGRILIGFTPDEEIGRGADHFDVSRFGADFAYTVDGGAEGSLEYENFNACGAHFTVNGVNVHPGSAKDVMINASLVAMEINSLLPEDEIPSKTSGYEGFYHMTDMKGSVERATLDYIVRDHSSESFEERKEKLRDVAVAINKKYGEGTVELNIKEQYRNMREKILPCMHLIDNAVQAARDCGVSATIEPIRGGTDGARLSFMGLPCPNLGTGGYAFHGPYEHITVEGMDKQTDILVRLCEIYSNVKR